MRVEPDGLVQILDGLLVLLPCAVRNTPVVVSKGVLRVEPYDLVEILNGPLVLIQCAVGQTSFVIGIAFLWVEPDGFVEVLYCPLVLPQCGIRNTPVVVGKGVLPVEEDGLIVLSYGLLMIALCCIVPASLKMVRARKRRGARRGWRRCKARWHSRRCCRWLRCVNRISRRRRLNCSLNHNSFLYSLWSRFYFRFRLTRPATRTHYQHNQYASQYQHNLVSQPKPHERTSGG